MGWYNASEQQGSTQERPDVAPESPKSMEEAIAYTGSDQPARVDDALKVLGPQAAKGGASW